MNWTEIILAVIAAILGGGNIFQWFQVRELKRKASAEAYQTEINSLRNIIDGNVAEINRLNASYAELQKNYFELAEELQRMKLQMKAVKKPRNRSQKPRENTNQ